MEYYKEDKNIKQFEYKECTHPDCVVKIYPATEEFFYKQKHKTVKSGVVVRLSSWCKTCQVKNTQKNIALADRDEKLKYFINYNKNKRDKEKEKIYTKERNKREREKFKNRLSLWQKSEIGKVKMKENNKKRQVKKHDVLPSEWDACKLYFNYRCAYCGMSWEDHKKEHREDLHKEHVIHDGRNDIKNCVPSCKSCNAEKTQETLNKWYNINNPKYTRERYLKIYQWLRYDCLKIVKKKKKKHT